MRRGDGLILHIGIIDSDQHTQGAQILSEHGVNVPPGLPAFDLDEVKSAAEKMASPDGEVLPLFPPPLLLLPPIPASPRSWRAAPVDGCSHR